MIPINGNHRRLARTLLKEGRRINSQALASCKRTPKRMRVRHIRNHLALRLKSQMRLLLLMKPTHILTTNRLSKDCLFFQIIPILITKLFSKSLNWHPTSKCYLYLWINRYNKYSKSITLSIISSNNCHLPILLLLTKQITTNREIVAKLISDYARCLTK